jgi:hypothetical protein
MEVRFGKKMATKKKWSKVRSQKKLTVVECWLTYSKEANEKEANHLALPMDRTTNWCSHGGWFTLALCIETIL